MRDPNLPGWVLSNRSPRSRLVVDIDVRDGKAYAVVAHEIRPSSAHPWHRRRGVALSFDELAELSSLIDDEVLPEADSMPEAHR